MLKIQIQCPYCKSMFNRKFTVYDSYTQKRQSSVLEEHSIHKIMCYFEGKDGWVSGCKKEFIVEIGSIIGDVIVPVECKVYTN